MANEISENQCEIVDRLLNDQDQVLTKLNELNSEIETLIESLAQERKAEVAAPETDNAYLDQGKKAA